MRKAIIISIFVLAACKHQQTTQTASTNTVVADEQKITRDEVFTPPSSSNSTPESKRQVSFKEETVTTNQSEPLLPIEPFPVVSSTVSLASLAEQNAPTQSYLIDQTNFSIVTGTQGTKLSIPPSVFMINDSTPYEGAVKIELREVYDQSQMVFANFSTTSDGQPIESAGMIYWNATTENGMPLQLDSGASVSVVMPRSTNAADYQLFSGSVNDGMMNWEILSSTSASLQVAIVPYNVFHYKRFKISSKIKSVDKNVRNEWNDKIESLAAGDFDQTTLCSKEFVRRIERIRWMGWNSELLSLYLENPNDLQRADSLALIQVGDYAMDIQQSSYPVSRKYFAIGAGKKRWIRETTRAFRVFYEESKYYGQNIYLTSKDIRGKKQLLSKGIEENYAYWLMHSVVHRYNQTNHGYKMEDVPRTLTSTTYITPSGSSFVTLRVPAMGYINCDRFLQSSRKEDIMVEIENYKDMDNVSATLIFKRINSMMSGYNFNGVITFKDIPVNYTACWLVIGTKNGQIYSAACEITHNQFPKAPVKEMLRLTTKEEIEKAIKDFLS